jgi:hypothetical protein
MKLLFITNFIFLFTFIFSSCNKPSYPKQNLPEHAKKLLKKELKIDGSLYLIGKTMYLEIEIPKEEIITEERKVLNNAIKKISACSIIITRLALSTDAKVDFLVSISKVKDQDFCIRTIQRLQDIKDYLYLRISRSDYEKRFVFEMLPYSKSTYKDITLEEFIGRLVASQYNMFIRTNPFLSALLSNLTLEFENINDKEIVLYTDGILTSKTKILLEPILREIYKEVEKKYSIINLPKNITIVDFKKQKEFFSF